MSDFANNFTGDGTRAVSATEAKNKFGQLLEVAAQEPIAITRNGRTVAVMISQQDFEWYENVHVPGW